MKKCMSILALSTVALGVQSGQISDYTLISGNNFVTNTETGREWLQWTETTNMTVAAAYSANQHEGWRIATNADMAALFSDFFLDVSWSSDENTTQSTSGQTTFGDGTDNSKVFGDLFGWTNFYDSVDVSSGQSPTGDWTGLFSTEAYFGLDADGDLKLNKALVRSENYRTYPNSVTEYPELATLFHDNFTITSSSSRIGVALVRDTVQHVPEPSTLALLGLGLFGLRYARKKSQA